jgi:hypothetical protein
MVASVSLVLTNRYAEGLSVFLGCCLLLLQLLQLVKVLQLLQVPAQSP